MKLTPEATKIINNYAAMAQYKRTPIFEKFIYCPLKTLALFTGNQCLAGETEIYDPVGKRSRRVEDIKDNFHVLAWDGDSLVPATAMKPFKKPTEQLYEVSLEDGSSFISTGGHQVLTQMGWGSVSSLRPGSSVFRPPSISGCDPSAPSEGDRRSSGTAPNSQAGCPSCLHSHDEQPRVSSGIAQEFSPSRAGVQEHKEPAFLRLDDRGSRHASIPLSRPSRPSSRGAALLPAALGAGSLSHASCIGSKHIYGRSQEYLRSHDVSSPRSLSGAAAHRSPNPSLSCREAFNPSSYMSVINVAHSRIDVTYDFHVPIFNNYCASGVIHHNCGKTAMTVFSWVLRFLSMHPVASKNFNWLICNRKKNHRFSLLTRKPGGPCNYMGCEGKLELYVSPFRKMRFASENLPFQNTTTGPSGKGGASIEVRNTLYPELIKWLPPYLIKKNISSHNTVMVIKDVWGMQDTIAEFVSYNQDVQAMAGVQLAGVLFDEEPPPAFFEEMQVRLLATDGSVDLALTPANRLTWIYDQIYEQAQVYYRSEAICRELGLAAEERTTSKKSIAVFQAATDDNPTLEPKTIERIMTDLDTDGDPDKLMIRRFGVFKAVSTTIFRVFSYDAHYLSMEKWFPSGIPDNWLHARSIDYHPVVPWAMVHISLSQTNEAFVWWEASHDPMRFTTDEAAMRLASSANDYLYKLDRIDPLANQKQPKRTRDEARTTSVTEDLNDQLAKLKARGIGVGGRFIGFDTKSTRGREQIKLRLKNAKECGEPFSNQRQDELGNTYYLPTLWIMDTCPTVAKSFKNWRLEDHADSGALTTKDAKETPQQKWSHFPMAIEGILKEDAFRPPVAWDRPDDRNRSGYFSQGRGDREIHSRVR